MFENLFLINKGLNCSHVYVSHVYKTDSEETMQLSLGHGPWAQAIDNVGIQWVQTLAGSPHTYFT